MERKFVDQRRFHELARRGEASSVGVQRPATVLRAGDGDGRKITFCLSDGSVDRMGDVIDPSGWDLKAYRANPIVLFAHDASAPPIGRMSEIHSDGMRLVGTVEFARADTYEFADTVYKLVREGFLKAGSVGFLPIAYSFSKDPDRPFGLDFHEAELLEFSVVPVPANAHALVTNARALVRGGGLGGDADRLGTILRLAPKNGARGAGCTTISAPLANTLGYAGTAAQRLSEWRHDHRLQIISDAAAARDLAIAAADRDTVAGRLAVVEAYRRYHESTA